MKLLANKVHIQGMEVLLANKVRINKNHNVNCYTFQTTIRTKVAVAFYCYLFIAIYAVVLVYALYLPVILPFLVHVCELVASSPIRTSFDFCKNFF